MNIRKLIRDDEMLPQTQAERAAFLALRPFQQFARQQASGSLLLILFAVCALIWANSPWATGYGQMLHEPFGVSFGEHLLRFDLHHWINDGLMAIFFFAVGLEIKREFLVGELAAPRKAMLPIAAAIGGMAIVDDLVALLVIAIFYTASVDWNGFAVAVAFLIALFAANRTGVRSARIYLALGAGLWYGLLISGLHATLAGVLVAMFVPARVRIVPDALAHVQGRDRQLDVRDMATKGLRGSSVV